MIRLKELRLEKGLLQKDIATILGKTITCICDWERGRTEPGIEDIKKIANYFEVSVDYLIGQTNELDIVQTNANLEQDEKQLLDLYRQMNFQDKNQLIGFAKALVY